jgi:glycosyltransferase involved in cell wall biosynthesis
MKILGLSFYYYPDLSAGSFRTTALVEALQRQVPAGSEIHVVTTLPNRYQTFSVEAPEIESHDGITIHRICLPAHKSGMLDQSRSFLVFSRRVSDYVEHRDYDIVFATSSRLMTAVLGAWIARKIEAPLYLDIRDIFVDTIRDILPRYLASTCGLVFGFIERWAIGTAKKVNLVSPGFSKYFSERYPDKTFAYFTNGIDDEFLSASGEKQLRTTDKKQITRALYAGNIGEGQGLHLILPELARHMKGQVIFRVIGDGGRKEALLSALAFKDIENVEILPPVGRDQLISEYQNADVLFLHLNDHDAFKKVLPSKLFEYAAMGKPIWAGVAGYAAEFVRSEISNAAVFSPCDVEEAGRSFTKLVLHHTSRDDFFRKYTRKNIMEKMAADILNMTNKN